MIEKDMRIVVGVYRIHRVQTGSNVLCGKGFTQYTHRVF